MSKSIHPVSRLSSIGIVVVGKSGVGKSAVGNTILGQKEFRAEHSMSPVTRKCSEAQATVSGRSVSVVDTPGFIDTQMKECLIKEIGRSVYLFSPGPHAFIIVFPLITRFSDEEKGIFQNIELMFGEEVLKYSIILFTHGDLLDGESVEELIEENCILRSLVQQCGGRYHVFNNRDEDNREQVEDLLQKIDSMIQQNGGAHYSNEMYEEAQRWRLENEKKRIHGWIFHFFLKYQPFVFISVVVGAVAGVVAGAGVVSGAIAGAIISSAATFVFESKKKRKKHQ